MRQILVHKTKHSNDLAFTSITLNSKISYLFQPGQIEAVDLDFDLSTLNELDKPDISFIWSMNPKLARLGAMLLGVEASDGKITAYISTVKEFKSKAEFPFLTGKAVTPVALRQIDSVGGTLLLSRPGAEL